MDTNDNSTMPIKELGKAEVARNACISVIGQEAYDKMRPHATLPVLLEHVAAMCFMQRIENEYIREGMYAVFCNDPWVLVES